MHQSVSAARRGGKREPRRSSTDDQGSAAATLAQEYDARVGDFGTTNEAAVAELLVDLILPSLKEDSAPIFRCTEAKPRDMKSLVMVDGLPHEIAQAAITHVDAKHAASQVRTRYREQISKYRAREKSVMQPVIEATKRRCPTFPARTVSLPDGRDAIMYVDTKRVRVALNKKTILKVLEEMTRAYLAEHRPDMLGQPYNATSAAAIKPTELQAIAQQAARRLQEMQQGPEMYRMEEVVKIDM